ncbi:hypothetical protein [Lysobacter sp. A3-1-A15]|uniref:hypothetical protein n=1 Tax=Novilysobacter viscosus TaxID=3098602 RepID=UPI002EDA5B22
MNFTADELRQELAHADATLDEAARHAGRGLEPLLERRLDAHLRSLRVMLGPDGASAAFDAVDAAKRVVESAEPAAPLRMLAMARETLTGLARRRMRAMEPGLAA